MTIDYVYYSYNNNKYNEKFRAFTSFNGLEQFFKYQLYLNKIQASDYLLSDIYRYRDMYITIFLQEA